MSIARRGFTLVELMIVVAIIGILAAIALPNFMQMQYRAKRAEAPLCVSGIEIAEFAYEAQKDHFLTVAAHPPSDPGKAHRTWAGGNSGFTELGWLPDGDVRGTYSVTTSGRDFTVFGVVDVDDDQIDAVYTATRSVSTIFINDNNTY